MNRPYPRLARHFSLALLAACFANPVGCRPAVEQTPSDEGLVGELTDEGADVTEDQIEVPDADADTLFQFMIDIESQELASIGVQPGEGLDGVDTDAYANALRRIMTARVTACDRILAGPATADSRQLAMRMKLEALRLLRDADPDGLGKRFDDYVTELSTGPDAQLALFAKSSRFQALVTDLISRSDVDESQIATELRELVDQPNAGEEVLLGAHEAVEWLMQSGRTSLAGQGFRMLGQKFSDHESPRVASLAAQVTRQAAQLDLMRHVERVVTGKDDATDGLLNAMMVNLDTIDSEDEALGVGIQLAQSLEYAGEFETVRQVYQLLTRRYREQGDPKRIEDVQRSFQLADQRISLIGEPLELDGVLLNAEPFDWTSYRGRHVVVCFWTSWYEGWPNEARAMRRAMDPFRGQGLKVVTINLDDDRNSLERFLVNHPLSWPIVVNPDPTIAGFQNPNAIRCGVESVPFVLLVDPDGLVVDIHLMGERLGQSLQRHINQAKQSGSPSSPIDTELRFVALLAPQNDDNEARTQDEDEGLTPQELLEAQLEKINPYAPPADASASELMEILLDMQDKPRSIQNRPGFSDGVIMTADRVLAMDAKPRWKTLALLAKLEYLRLDALKGNETAQASLLEALDRWNDDARPEVAKELRFLRLEQRAQAADTLDADGLTSLLADLSEFFGNEPLGARHLQVASLTVHAINRIEDVKVREEYFESFGTMFAKSDDKQLSAYGKRIAKPASGDNPHLNTELELVGVTTAGTLFNWQAYRDRWVVVDFWASWCGPCRRAMPELRELSKQFKDENLEIVGVSLDKDLDALADYLAKEELPWTILAGPTTETIAKKYDVRGIPHLMLVDGDGKIRLVTHRVSDIASALKKRGEDG